MPLLSDSQSRLLRAGRPSHGPCNAPCAKHARPAGRSTSRGLTVTNSATLEREDTAPGLKHTVWDQHKLTQRYPTLREDLTADVVVVGAGIAGLSTAYHLAKAGQRVVVLESRFRGAGQTGKTTAHLMEWNDDYYFEIEKLHGFDRAKQMAEAQRAACLLVGEIAEAEGFDCKYAKHGGYLFPDSSKASALERLNNEADAVQRLGLPGCKKVDLGGGPEVGGIGEALFFPDAADFQPLLYLDGLAEAITKRGGKIFETSPVASTEGPEVKTQQGHTVRAPNVVLATNSPIHHNLAVHARQEAARSYVVGLKAPEGGVKETQFWDTATPYHYIRTERHEEHGLILVVGGEDHQVGMKTEDYTDSYAQLEAYARSRWTKAGETVFRWSGEVIKPIDQLHLYGQDPLNDLQQGATYYVATGDSGQGTTGGTIGGVVIASQILGNPHPWSDMVSPSRAPPPGMIPLSQLATVGGTTISSFSRLVVPELRPTDVDDLKPGEGNVLQRGVSKYAVYKDEQGRAHTFSPVCPHLGCVVQWNPNEQSFDCPCHGSQFDSQGQCIQGPAKANLAPVELHALSVEEKS